MTHSVLIIDDARSVISVAKNVIPAYPELYPVVEAKNSIVGLELLNNLRAELVILKYDMPFLNGHEFLRKVLSMGVRTQYILIFSEDLENEFPSLTLRNDISSILFEKDLTFDTLHEAIRKAIADMKKTEDLYQIVQKYEDLLQDSPQMIQSDRQTIFSEMISGIYSGEERLKRIFHDENSAVFWLVLVEVSQDTDSGFTFYLHLESIKALQEKMRKQANLYQGVDIFIVHDQKLCMVIEPGSPAAAAAHAGNLEPILQDFSKLARWLSLPSFVFTFFDQPVALSQLALAYKSISDFSKYRFFHYESQILKSSQASADEIMREDPVIRDLLSQAAILTSEHDEHALMSTFQDLVQKLCAAASFRVFSYAWNRLLFIYNLEMQKFHLPEEEFSPDIRQNDFHNIDDAMRALIVLYHKLFAGIRRKLYVGNELIEKSLIYMSKHYAECLSLADVANHVNVSNAYLSRLFSKETGLSFVDHLNQIRISKAQELLKDRKIRINEVADQVGYTNAKYFSQVFRKITGCTPYDFKIKGC